MAYTTIDKSDEYFNTVLWTGNSTARDITTGHATDFAWLKVRDTTGDHFLFDIIRGTNNYVRSNLTSAEGTLANTLTAFNSDGFSLGTANAVNASGETQVGWSWKANGAGVSNTDGSITSTVSANTTSGFSIVQWTGTQANGTIGHGLGVAPSMIIVKANAVKDWMVGHDGIGWTKYINLNTTGAASTASTVWQDTAPTSSVFSVGSSSDVNTSSTSMIAYCFADVKGFSKFGSYTGNGSTDGTFVYTGFKPAYFLLKQSSASGEDWVVQDNKRNTFNPVDATLYASASNAENSGYRYCDFNANGFKIRNSQTDYNQSGETYIYMAFAENPFVTSTGIPTTAR
jgi:hypothetical protein